MTSDKVSTKTLLQTCDGILHQVDETLDLFNELQLQHQVVATKAKTLHDACDRLLIKKQRLIEFAEALRSKLKYFDELENRMDPTPQWQLQYNPTMAAAITAAGD
ncbi:hypothetical protein CsSME_00004120 [Camellia sinensis var. sinensis]